MTELIAPNGLAIRGTLELVPGVALATVTRDEKGAIVIEHEGETEIFWDDQETVLRDGKEVFVDDEGNEWTGDQLVEADDGDGEEEESVPAPTFDPNQFKPGDTVIYRNAAATVVRGHGNGEWEIAKGVGGFSLLVMESELSLLKLEG